MAPDQRRNLGANAGLLLTMFFWGSMIPVVKGLLPTWDALAISAIRYVIAVPLFLAVLYGVDRGAMNWRGLPWWRLWFIGGLGMSSFSILFLLGISFSDPITAAVITTCGPVVAALMARIFFAQPMAKGTGIALILAVSGGMIAIAGGTFNAESNRQFLGITFIILAQISWSWYTLAGQRWLPGLSQLRLTTFTIASAAVWLIGADIVAISNGWAQVPTWHPSGKAIALITWLVVTGTSGGVFLWNYGSRIVGVVVASLYLNLIPLFSVLISMAFIGTIPAIGQIIGGVLILIGVIQVQLRRAA